MQEVNEAVLEPQETGFPPVSASMVESEEQTGALASAPVPKEKRTRVTRRGRWASRKNVMNDEEAPDLRSGQKMRKAQLTAALAYLYYMQGGKFVPEHMPVNRLEMLFGVTRHTIYRCIADVQSSLPVAKKLFKELTELSAQEMQARQERAQMTREADYMRSTKNRTKRAAKNAVAKAKRLQVSAQQLEIERRAMKARHDAQRKSQRDKLYANGLRPPPAVKRQPPLRMP